jgi:protein SCO1/2
VKKIINTLFILFFIWITAGYAGQNVEPGIQEHLGAKIPLNLTFKDANGKDIKLSRIFTRSTVVAFVYYRCPGLCDPLMTEIANVVNKVDMVPGKDYDIVSIGFDDRETPKDALEKKKTFTGLVNINLPDTAWRFLTGDSLTIAEATDAAGFNFKRVPNGFIHTSILLFVSKDGKICRYLYPDLNARKQFGILPFDFKMAVMEASQGNAIPMVGKIAQFCFSFDPLKKSYTPDLLKIFGAGIVIGAAVFFVILLKPKKGKGKQKVEANA